MGGREETGSEDATLFRGFISGEIKNPAQGHRCSICFADSALGSPSMPVNINQARHLNATGPTSRGQQIFNMRLRPQRSHLSLEIEGNTGALYVQYGFTEAGLMWLRIYRMSCITVTLFIIPAAGQGWAAPPPSKKKAPCFLTRHYILKGS